MFSGERFPACGPVSRANFGSIHLSEISRAGALGSSSKLTGATMPRAYPIGIARAISREMGGG